MLFCLGGGGAGVLSVLVTKLGNWSGFWEGLAWEGSKEEAGWLPGLGLG